MDIGSASTRLAPQAPATEEARLAESARDFEASYLAAVFETMLEDAMPAPAGGFGEEMFRGMLAGSLAEAVASAGGVGLAATVEAQMREYMK